MSCFGFGAGYVLLFRPQIVTSHCRSVLGFSRLDGILLVGVRLTFALGISGARQILRLWQCDRLFPMSFDCSIISGSGSRGRRFVLAEEMPSDTVISVVSPSQ